MTDRDSHQTEGDASVWWRTRWLDAIYESDLTPTQRFVAVVYADFAGNGRTSWASISTVMHRTGYSNRCVIDARRALTTGGWLLPITKPERHKAATFALAIPGVSQVHPSPDPGVNVVHTRGEPGSRLGVNLAHTSNPLSINDQSSLSPNQTALRKILGCSPEDERLKIADSLITSHGVRSASAWLRKAHDNGDLADLIAEEQAKAQPGHGHLDGNGEETWMQAARSSTSVRDIAYVCENPDCEQGWVPGNGGVAHCPTCRPGQAGRYHQLAEQMLATIRKESA